MVTSAEILDQIENCQLLLTRVIYNKFLSLSSCFIITFFSAFPVVDKALYEAKKLCNNQVCSLRKFY